MKRRTFTEAVHDGAERPGGGVEELVDVLEEEHVGVQVDELVVVLKLQATAASRVLLRSTHSLWKGSSRQHTKRTTSLKSCPNHRSLNRRSPDPPQSWARG